MNNFRTVFTTWWDKLQKTYDSNFEAMRNTVENSPYHRERNTFVHTQMVVDEYIGLTDNRVGADNWQYSDMLGAVAAVFHDIGKPMSEETVHKDDGSVYRRYANHERMSGGFWCDYWLENRHNIRELVKTEFDFYCVHVMISYHLPYSASKDKVDNMKIHFIKTGTYDSFVTLLQADVKGRISDDPVESNKRTQQWIDMFDSIDISSQRDCNNRTVFIMCGVSGSGKSTFTNSIKKCDDEVFSFDTIRTTAFPNYSYGTSYNDWVQYFKNGSMDSQWIFDLFDMYNVKNPVLSEAGVFMKLLEVFVKNNKDSNNDIFIDNTNLSYSARRKIINNLKGSLAYGNRCAVIKYKTFFDIVYDNFKRKGKTVDTKVLMKQYYEQFMPPIYGEFDTVYIDIS